MKIKNFLDMSFDEFRDIIPWNRNFHCFEGLDNAERIYLWAAEEAYHCLIDCLYSFPSHNKCYAKDRIDSVKMFSLKDFEKTFNLNENAKYVAKFSEFTFDDVFFIAIEDVFNLFQFIKKYEHPKVKNGDTILQHPSFEKDTATHYTVTIGDTINAMNSEGKFLKEDIPNPDKKDFIYLDELFGLLTIAEGYFLTIKNKSS